MKRAFSFFLCIALVLSLFAGCSGEETPGTTGDNGLFEPETEATKPTQPAEDAPQKICLAYDPEDSFNPYQTTGHTNRVLFSLIYQGLFTVDADYEAKPMLCQSYNISADKKTYTFHLADANFSDGTAVTAADVSASLKAAQESPWYGGRLQHVTSIGHYGDAVVLELDTPMENLPILLDIPVVKAGQVNAEKPIGTGPYQFVGNKLQRQAAWWCEVTLPFDCDTVDLISGESTAAIRDAFEFDDVTLVLTDPSAPDYVSFHNDYELWDCENGLFLYLVCNPDHGVFANEELRTNLTHAIDRDSLVSAYYNDFAYSATLPASPQFAYYSGSLANNFGYDPDKFQKAVDAAQLELMEISLLVNGGNALRVKVAKTIAKALEGYGFTVKLEQATGDDYAYLLAKGDFDLFLGQTRLSANMDLSAFFGTNSPLSYGGLSDPATYATCLEALSDGNNYYSLYEMIMNEGRLCPILFQSFAIYARRGALTGFAPSRDNIFYYDLGTTLADALMKE